MKTLFDAEVALEESIATLDKQILALSTSPQRCHELKLMRHALCCVVQFMDEPHTDKIKLT